MGGWGGNDDPPSPTQLLASRNAYRQLERTLALITEALAWARPVRLTPEMICELHGLAMAGLIDGAGTLRRDDVRITGSRHAPPPWADVPRLIDELCDYANTSTRDAIHVAAYVLWRLNWIHPFAPDGNGRTARAVVLVVLFTRLGVEPVTRPDRPAFLEVLGWRKYDCVDALEAADAACGCGEIDVGRLEELLVDVLKQSFAREPDAV
jgi:hypothetical protein